VYLSDVIRLGGRVTEKEIKNGEAVVTIETWATNQRDQNVMPGSAVVALPRRLRPVVTLIPLEDNVKEK
jgi:acyl dehydratase